MSKLEFKEKIKSIITVFNEEYQQNLNPNMSFEKLMKYIWCNNEDFENKKECIMSLSSLTPTELKRQIYYLAHIFFISYLWKKHKVKEVKTKINLIIFRNKVRKIVKEKMAEFNIASELFYDEACLDITLYSYDYELIMLLKDVLPLQVVANYMAALYVICFYVD